MEQSPSWKANRFSASQEIPRILWNAKVHLIYNCTPPVPILSQINPFYAHHPTSWISLLILSYYFRIIILPLTPGPSKWIYWTPGVVKSNIFFFSWLDSPLVGLALPYGVSRPHWDTPHSVGPLWANDRPVAETITWQHATLKKDIHVPGGDSNPQSQQESGRRLTS